MPYQAVVIGDSGSTGYGTTGYDDAESGGRWQDTPNGWVANMARMWPDSQWEVRSHNGAMVSDFLPGGRWPTSVETVDVIGELKPQLVLIMLGGNEFGMDVDPAEYQDNLQTLTSNIRAVSGLSNLVYVSMWEFTYRWGDTQNHTWGEYRTAMQSVAASNNGTFIALSKFMPRTDTDTAGLYLPDEYGPGLSVHLTDAGNWPVFAAVRTFLEPT